MTTFDKFVRYVEESMCELIEKGMVTGVGVPPMAWLLGKDSVYLTPILRSPKTDIEDTVRIVELAHNESVMAAAFGQEVVYAQAENIEEANKLMEEREMETLPKAIMLVFKMNGENKVFVYKSRVEKNGTVRFLNRMEIELISDFVHLFEGICEKKKLH